jgi:diketogulonate reductase-like aldo/keto reductase
VFVDGTDMGTRRVLSSPRRRPKVTLPSGERVPALGLGTWRLGEHRRRRDEEIATIRFAIELGLCVIDTAEMYGEGRAEALVGEAIAGRRNRVFLVDKVLPDHATRVGTIAACEESLRRLKTDRIDLYLLHWRGDVPLADTVRGFQALVRSGKIRYWGVSNFDVSDMEDLVAAPGGPAVATDQVLYNLARRVPEAALFPWLRQRGIPVMAYSPFEQARLLRDEKLEDFAQRHGLTPAQAALGWLLSHQDVLVIPKTGNRERLREDAEALDRPLTPAQLEELDQLFPPPDGPRPLETL